MNNPILHLTAALILTLITSASAVATDIDLSTGIDDTGGLITFGNADDTWTLVDAPDGVALGPIVVVEPARAGFLTLEPDARWVSPDTETNEDAPFGPYTYQATFDTSGWTGAEVSGSWGADNRLLQIRINSVIAFTGPNASGDDCPAAGCEEFNTPSSFIISNRSGLFVDGLNTIEVVINNDGPTSGNPTAFVLNAHVTETPADVTITVDPAAYPSGTDLGIQFPGIELTTVQGYVDFVDFDPTPTLIETIRQTGPAVGSIIASGPHFASPDNDNWASDPQFGRFEVFKAAFAFPVKSVSMRFTADDTDTGVLGAFDEQGNLLAHEFLRSADSFVLTVTSTDVPIAYVLAGTSDPAFLGAMSIQGVPDPGRALRGEGLIESAPESCQLDGGGQNAAGIARFRTLARYKSGSTAPIGRTTFHLRKCGLVFKSTAYDWFLSTRSKSILRGMGAVNEVDGFGFQLVTIDGHKTRDPTDQDRFRIKIWDATDGHVVYDNEIGAAETFDPTTALFDGWILIRKVKPVQVQ